MSELTDQLQSNREAVLLLYLADELPGADRAELERILSSDSGLRMELEGVRELQAAVAGGLEQMDVARPLHVSEEVSTRRVMREIRRFQLELSSRAPVQLEASSLRSWPKWVYPVGAAAAAIVMVLGLWGVGVIDFQPTLAEQNRSQMQHYEGDEYPMYRDQVVQERLARILLASFGADESDHAADVEETEDPAALRSNG